MWTRSRAQSLKTFSLTYLFPGIPQHTALYTKRVQTSTFWALIVTVHIAVISQCLLFIRSALCGYLPRRVGGEWRRRAACASDGGHRLCGAHAQIRQFRSFLKKSVIIVANDLPKLLFFNNSEIYRNKVIVFCYGYWIV